MRIEVVTNAHAIGDNGKIIIGFSLSLIFGCDKNGSENGESKTPETSLFEV